MKKILKSRVFIFILGFIIATAIGVYAINASEISYGNTTVDQAIDDLYNIATTNSIKMCKLIDQTHGTKGTIGAKYECTLGDKDTNDNYVKRNFYILKVNDTTVDLIMERNITDFDDNKTLTWENAMNYFTSGVGVKYKNAWTNVVDINLPKAYMIARATGNNSFPESSASYSNRFSFGTSNGVSQYDWIFNYTNSCASDGCDSETSLTNYSDGYWTTDVPTDVQHNAFVVFKNGSVTTTGKTDTVTNGVRPVITILKSSLYE